MAVGATVDDVSKRIGKHIIVDMRGASRLDDEVAIKSLLRRCAEKMGATILGGGSHVFPGTNGVTAFLLLAESHISVHTWPEHGYAALDMFTCGDVDPACGLPVIREEFGSAELIVREYVRGTDLSFGVERSQRLMRHLYEDVLIGEVWSRGNYHAVDDVLSPEFRDRRPIPEFPGDRDGHREMARSWRESFPDMTFVVESVVIDGDVLVGRYSAQGTHSGTPFMGHAPSGRTVTLTGIDWCRFADERIVEWHHNEDIAGVLERIADGVDAEVGS